MKNRIFTCIILTFIFSLHSMDLVRPNSSENIATDDATQQQPLLVAHPAPERMPYNEAINTIMEQTHYVSSGSSDDENPQRRQSRSPQAQSPRTILINAIHADDDEALVMGLFNFTELNTPGQQYDRDDPLLCVAAGLGRRTIVETLLDNGASVATYDGHQASPLHYAVRFGHLTIAEILRAQGASLETRNIWGQTVIHQALEITPLNFDIIEWLVREGADVNAQDEEGSSAAHYAYMHKRDDLLELLDTVPNINWVLENHEGTLPSQMPKHPYYLTPPPSRQSESPPPLLSTELSAPSPKIESRTISYHDLDELLGYYFEPKIEHAETEIHDKRIITHYYRMRLCKEDPEITVIKEQLVTNQNQDSSTEDCNWPSFDEQEKEISGAAQEAPDQLLIEDNPAFTAPYAVQEYDTDDTTSDWDDD